MRSYRSYSWETFSTPASLPEVSLKARTLREFSLGFGTIKASFWRCSGVLTEVSPVFDRTEIILGEIFPHPPAFQGSLGKRTPPVSSLSGSIPSRHLFGAVAVYYRGSLQHAILHKLFLVKYFSYPLAFPKSLWKRAPPHEFSLGFGIIKASFWRCSGLLPGVSPIFDRTETTLGEIFPISASLPEVSLEARPRREFSLGFGTIKAFFCRCSGLLSGVSPIFDRTETTLGEIFPISASLPEVSLEARPRREFSLGFGTIKAFFCRCTKLPPEVSPVLFSKAIFGTLSTSCVTPHEFSRGLVITELSLRPIVECRIFFNSFDAHAGWVRDWRGERSLNLLFCRLPVFNVDKQLDV